MKIYFVEQASDLPQLTALLPQEELFDSKSLYPLTFLKSVLDLRVGMLTLREKWLILAEQSDVKCTVVANPQDADTFVAVNVLPSISLLHTITALNTDEILFHQKQFVACRAFQTPRIFTKRFVQDVAQLNGIEDIFMLNGKQISEDYMYLAVGGSSVDICPSNQVLGDNLFLAAGAQVHCATLNTLTGPIYIDRGAVVMEGAHLRGPLYLGQESVVKMGATVYGNVTIGKQSVVGGEVSNTVIGDYSAKGHHGYLGCSVIGDWCNFGAGTSNSNLKNNLKTVSIFDYRLNGFRDTGLQKCGLFMGDFSRAGINSSFNTGTVVGLGCMLADTTFYAKFVPSYTWIFQNVEKRYELDRFVDYVERALASKDIDLSLSLKEKLNQLNSI